MLLYILSMVETDEERSLVTNLYLTHKKLMKIKVYEILKDDSLAEEAVNEAFVKLLKYLHKIQIDEIDSHKTKNFMVIISKRAAQDIIMRENRYKTVSIEELTEFNIECLRYNDNVDDLLNVGSVKKVIGMMPEIYREVLMLKVYYDLSDANIALQLNISNSAVRKRLQRARAILYELLKMENFYAV